MLQGQLALGFNGIELLHKNVDSFTISPSLLYHFWLFLGLCKHDQNLESISLQLITMGVLDCQPHLAMPNVRRFCVLISSRLSFDRHRYFLCRFAPAARRLACAYCCKIVASVAHFLGATPWHGQWWLGTNHVLYDIILLSQTSYYM